MSAYIWCPKCEDETLDVDTLSCSECGWSPHETEALLRARVEELEAGIADVCDRILGPSAPTCDGCSAEIADALENLRALLPKEPA